MCGHPVRAPVAAFPRSGHHGDDPRPILPFRRPPLIHTHPLGWTDPALPTAAALLVDRYTSDAIVDLRGVLVAVPGARAGRRLKELLVEVADARQLRLAPPKIVTVGDLPERLFRAAAPAASGALRRVVWTTVLRDAPSDELERLFARRPPAHDVAAWSRLGREVERLHRSVARGGHDFASVEAECRSAFTRGALGWDDTARWSALGKLEAGYRRRLSEAGRVDPDLERLRALDSGEMQASGDLWLLSIPEMPGAVREAVRAVAEQGTVHVAVHAPDSELDGFDALGCVRPEAWERAHVPLTDAQIVLRDQPADQADAVAEVLAGLQGERAADEIVIGVPDGALAPWVEERLGDAGVPVRDAAGTPLEHTAPYRLLEAVAEVLDGRRYEGLAALARHPDFGHWMAASAEVPDFSLPGEWVPALDAWYMEFVPARLPDADQELPGGGLDRYTPVVNLVKAVDEALLYGADLGGTDARPIGAWMRPLLELLARVYSARKLRRTIPADRDVLRSLDALAQAAQAFERMPASVDLECSATAAIRLVLEQVKGTAIPSPADAAAVEMLGWLELPLDDAAVVVVTGANEPRLPESVAGDAFLPDALRTAIGLVDNRRRYARDAYRLTAMAHTAAGSADRRLAVIAGRRTASGDPLRPSRLLFAAPGETVVARVLEFYDPSADRGEASAGLEGDVAGAGESAAASASGAEGDESGFLLPPEPFIPAADAEERLARMSATRFRALLTDPYLFALAHVRGCDTVDDHERELNGAGFGDLAHRVLERFGRNEQIRASTDPAEISAFLDRDLDARAAARFGPEGRWSHVAVRIQLEQLRTRLHHFAEWQATWIAEGWRVHAVEVAPGDAGVTFEVPGQDPVRIRARIDRVDHHPETGRWVVWDYKTSERGATPEDTHRSGEDWVDLQLPLYRWLLPRLIDEQGRYVAEGAAELEVDVGYILLPRALEEVGGVMAEWDDSEHAEALEAGREAIRRVRAEGFQFDPQVRLAYPEPELEALLGHGRLVGLGTDDDEEGA